MKRPFNKILPECLCILLIFNLTGCKKLIEIDAPIDRTVASDVYKKPNLAIAAMTGIYAEFGQSSSFTGSNGISAKCGLLADEFRPGGSFLFDFFVFRNELDDPEKFNFWSPAYRTLIFRINSIIEGVASSQEIPVDTKNKLIAEVKFSRALIYFYLVNIYGDVPLVLTTNFKENANIPRAPVSKVYDQIIADLLEAELNLTNEYLGNDLLSVTENRVRPNKLAVNALLARVYLFTEQWNKAEEEATKVINDSKFELVNIQDNIFAKNSRETIWALQPNPLFGGGTNTPDGRLFLDNSTGGFSLAISERLESLFEIGDKRRQAWLIEKNNGAIKVPYKYRIGPGDTSQPQNEYTIVFRLAEQYLIRAEAKLNQGNPTACLYDINVIRKRAGLDPISLANQQGLENVILKERQIELFSEWGHRWFDLKRTNRIDEVMMLVAPTKISAGKSASWSSYKSLLPIPFTEFSLNPALVGHQNEGYSESL